MREFARATPILGYCPAPRWGRSSAGRAPHWQCGGQGFDPPRLHQIPLFRVVLSRWVPLAAVALIICLSSAVASAEPTRAGVAVAERGLLGDVTETPPPRAVHYLRAGAWMGVMLGAGSVWYVLDDRNVLDWDKPSMSSRLTGESWRFDNNGFGMNFILHPINGSGFYAFSRANRLGAWQAALFSFLTSMTWEYIIEYNERVSINDVITTPLAGIAVGEFAHKLGWYLNSAPGSSPLRTTLAWGLGPTVAVHRALDGEEAPRSRLDNLGYSSAMWHRFGLGVSASAVETRGGHRTFAQRYEAEGKLVSLRGYRQQEGVAERWFGKMELVSLSLAVDHSRRGAGLDLRSEVWLAGYHSQVLGLRGRGEAHTVGVTANYTYRNTTSAGDDERMAWVGAPGLAADSWFRNGPWSTEIEARAMPIFGALSSPPFAAWRERYPEAKTKTILEKHGYAFGWGAVGELSLRATTGPVSLRSAIQGGTFGSDEGLDRDQDDVERDVATTERWVAFSQRVSYSIPHAPLVIGLVSENRARWSRVGFARATTGRKSVGIWAGVEF